MELIELKSLFKKAGVLAAATTLAASLAFVGATNVANAADVAVVTDAQIILPGGSVNMTISGCSVGAELIIIDGTTEEGRSVTVAADTLPMTVTVNHDSFFSGDDALYTGGDVTVGAQCIPDAETSEEAPSQSLTDLYVYGRWVEADPSSFYAGDPVTLTAGDFPAGTAVTLELYPEGSDELVWSAPLGTAGDDLSVTGVATFPADLECGTYGLDIVGGDLFVPAELYICGEPEPTPTPTPTPTETASPSPSPSPTATVTSTPTASPSASATTAPTSSNPSRPGLPHTGN